MTDDELRQLLTLWRDRQDEGALSRALSFLLTDVPGPVVSMLGRDSAEDVVHRTVERLFSSGHLVLAERPRAFVRTCVRREALSERKKLARRGRVHSLEGFDRPGRERGPIDGVLDALDGLSALDADQRLAVLIEHDPQRIPVQDWDWLVQRHETPPERPERPLERDEASRLFWPPSGPESPADVGRRVERLRGLLRRAYDRLRKRLGGGA